MGVRFQVVMDAKDPQLLAGFWRSALGFVAEKPPEGFATWADFAEQNGIPADQWPDSAVDPDGVLPRLFFQPVPEDKTVKNRVHLDLDVGKDAVDAEVERLVGAGAKVIARHDGFVTLADPEGNEFDVQ
jgi:hypothetical protein